MLLEGLIEAALVTTAVDTTSVVKKVLGLECTNYSDARSGVTGDMWMVDGVVGTCILCACMDCAQLFVPCSGIHPLVMSFPSCILCQLCESVCKI